MKKTKKISLFYSVFPILILVVLLSINVFTYGDASLDGSNQFILLIGGFIASLIGFKNNISFKLIIDKIGKNLKTTTSPILILLFVGALGGTWLASGIIPAMIFYGLKIINPTIFLPTAVILSALTSLVTGSSWSTSATIGIALIGIGQAMGINPEITAGAVISGAYFGDKLSPLSDTTNLASAIAECDLFNHIKYLLYTTLPSIFLTMIVFTYFSLSIDSISNNNVSEFIISIEEVFFISPILFVVPILIIIMIIYKTPPLVALFFGTILGAIFTIIFQPEIIKYISNENELNIRSCYIAIVNSIIDTIQIQSDNEVLKNLFVSNGMKGMLGTIWLIICAMVFGGSMDAIGALDKITDSLLKIAKSNFNLIISTVSSCIIINTTASDQYLSIILPGKMFKNSFKKNKLAPENLSRTLEDSGTVTSVLIPWNTCGAYQSSVLGVNTFDYLFFSVFNWLSPIFTIIYSYFNFKIKKIQNSLS